jgi:hypothetical protein
MLGMSTSVPYPVHVSAALDHPSRGLWLVKWLLAIPHYVVLAFLWLGFAVLSVVAFFAILFTGRYPRAIFDYNVGVLRWSWRVSYYAYGALGTDHYPPFTLQDVPGYPAHLSVDYPERLSRGLVLVKWWLLAIPHYIIVGFFVGGGAWFAPRSNDNWQWSWGSGGLVSILVLIAAVVLLFSNSYPRSLFDVVLGMQRWALRVAGYVALMTDVYPPFRLDLGGDDPDTMTLQPAATIESPIAGVPEAGAARPLVGSTAADGVRRWTGGRVTSLVVGALIAFVAVGPLIGGVALIGVDRWGRDSAGYLTSPTASLSSGGYALTSDKIMIEAGGPAWALPSRVLGTARVRVTPSDPARAVFVAVGPTSAVTGYLSGVQYATPSSFGGPGTTYTEHSGGQPGTPPTAQTFWTAKVTGTGTQTLSWEPTAGDWTLVVMNADSSPGVTFTADAAATAPAVTWIGISLLVAGVIGLIIGALLIVVPISAVNSEQTRTRAPVVG